MKSRRAPRNAFTLVELLVVIVIIAIIAAVLLPGITSRPRPAPNISCLNNSRQITLAIQWYVTDWTHDAAGNTNSVASPFLGRSEFRTLIAPYLSIKHPPSPQDRIFACPRDTFYYATNSKGVAAYVSKPLHEQSNYVFSSYAYNAGHVITGPTANSPATTNFHGIAGMWLREVGQPSRTVLVAEIPAFEPYSWHYPKKPFSRQNSRFNDSRNIVGFVDGHVELVKMYYDGNKPAWDYNPPTRYKYQWTKD
jgi:prepilin-type N-terminal cleavage/methylation domain-containing protein/prepilin-type processing-associated H-X9-DG protein